MNSKAINLGLSMMPVLSMAAVAFVRLDPEDVDKIRRGVIISVISSAVGAAVSQIFK
jgi:hypothetical protein